MKVSILGTCQECLHYADGMCDLRPRICFNYDHFERLPMVTLRRDVFETQYISRAMFDAEVVRLTAELAAANKDAGQLSSEYSYYEEDTGWRCIHCGASHKHSGWKMVHEDNCPITLHRARVGGV